MIKISVKNIIKFIQKSDKSKKRFLNSLNKGKKENSSGGGDYWVRSVSALNNAFKTSDNQCIKEKIIAISTDYDNTERKQTKDMYKRNIGILHMYEDFNFSNWYPNKSIRILEKINKRTVIEIQKVPVEVSPSQVFTFTKNKIDYVGAIWFVAKLDGYSKPELGIFSETLFNYLTTNFSGKYEVSPKNCLVVDIINLTEVTYQMILDSKIPALLNDSLKSLKENL